MRVFTVTVHSVGFPLVAKQACIGREVCVHTLRHFASVWLEMRVEVFAVVN